jgi:predicted signal transduction protein with EAL and GGDEF domain
LQLIAIRCYCKHRSSDPSCARSPGGLRACAREGDTWARLGDDEFALVQPGLREPSGAEVVARRVLEALAAPFRTEEGQELDVGASLGLTVFPDDGDMPERLVRNVDVVLYRAKAAGRGRFRLYRPEMDRELRESRSPQQGLKCALEAGGLRLVYQQGPLGQAGLGAARLLDAKHASSAPIGLT